MEHCLSEYIPLKRCDSLKGARFNAAMLASLYWTLYVGEPHQQKLSRLVNGSGWLEVPVHCSVLVTGRLGAKSSAGKHCLSQQTRHVLDNPIVS